MAVSEAAKRLYFPVLKTIARQWAARLTTPEFVMLGFVNERTLRFGKVSELVTITQAIHGIVNLETGEVIHAGCGLKRTAIKKAFRALHDRGLIDYEVRYQGSNKGAMVTIMVEEVLSVASKSDIGITKRRVRKHR